MLHTTTLGDQGPSIVFLHGLFGQGRNWNAIGQALAPEHRVTLVDLPHHGRSDWAERFDFVEIADQIAEILPADDPVTLVGHSLGGKVAMIVALLHPDRVAKLVVADIAPIAYRHGGLFADYIAAMQAIDLTTLTRRQDAEAALREAVPEEATRLFLLQNLRRERSADGVDSWRWQMNLDVLGRDLDVLSGWPEDALAQAAPYGGPVLWVGGSESGYIRDENAAAMARWFPSYRKVVIKNAGHWLHADQPEVFTETVRRFAQS